MVDKGPSSFGPVFKAKFLVKLYIKVRSIKISFQDGSLVAFGPLILILYFFSVDACSLIFSIARSIES